MIQQKWRFMYPDSQSYF